MTPDPRVAGVDLSLAGTGLALPDGTYATIKARGADYERHYDLVDRIVARLDETSTDAVGIEGYALNAPFPLALIRAGEIGGVLRTVLTRRGIPFVDVPPATVKKFATNNGRAHKSAVYDAAIAEAEATLDPDRRPANYDEADAHYVRRIVTLLRGARSDLEILAPHQRRALEKLLNPEG